MKKAAPTGIIRIRLWAELAMFALIFMEVISISAYYHALSGDRIALWSIFVVLSSIVIFSHLLARFLDFTNVPLRNRRIVMGTWVFIALYGSLKLLVLAGQPTGPIKLLLQPFQIITGNEAPGFAAFWHILLIGILVWRGVSLARQPLGIIQTLRSFQLGLLLFMAYGFAFSKYEVELKSFSLLFLFLFFGIMSLTATRIAGISLLRGGKAGKFSPQWIATISIAIILITATALLLGVTSRGVMTSLVERLTYLVFSLLTGITFIVAYPIVWVISLLAPLFQKLFANMPELTILQDLMNMINNFSNQPNNVLPGLSGPVTSLRIIGRLGAFAALLLVIFLALKWKPFTRRPEGEEEVADLPGRLRIPFLPRLDTKGVRSRLTGASRWLAAARIRRIYADLMHLCEQMGHPRAKAVTPLEFLPDLFTLFPDSEPNLEQITKAYLKIRYGELPETMAEVQSAEQAWETIRKQGRRAVAEQRRRAKKDPGLNTK